MAVEIDLETRIYLILSDEKGHTHGDLVRLFGNECPKKYNKGTISNKLNSMEMKGYIKKDERLMPDRKQNYYPFYIKKDIEVFRHILKKLTKHIEVAPLTSDPRRLLSLLRGETVDLSLEGFCKSISEFVRSGYTLRIIEKYGFETTYIIFKKETCDYCNIMPYAELAEDLRKSGKMSREELGTVFLADLEEKIKSLDLWIKISERLENS